MVHKDEAMYVKDVTSFRLHMNFMGRLVLSPFKNRTSMKFKGTEMTMKDICIMGKKMKTDNIW